MFVETITAKIKIEHKTKVDSDPSFWKDIIFRGTVDRTDGVLVVTEVTTDLKEIPDPLETLPEIIYAVPWIEVDFGQRDEGHKLYTDLDKCKIETRKASRDGPGKDGYYGPERPLHCIEVPTVFLEEDLQANLKKRGGITWTKNHWSPRFKGNTIYID